MNNPIIAIDADGTLFTHDYPEIGKDIGAWGYLRQARNLGAKFILWTMRSESYLEDVVELCKFHTIPLFGINRNPEQVNWTTSAKAYANIYVDDAALGCPLKIDKQLSHRPFVDWSKVGPMLIDWIKSH